MRLFYLFIYLLLFTLRLPSMAQSSPVRLWEHTKVKASHVTLTPFLPQNDGKRHIAIIICPGGSYFWLADKTEGSKVAEWLQNNGIAAFVLKYRTAGWGAFATRYRLLARGHQYPDMLQDTQRALQYIREHHSHYNIDTAKVGIMGFSAGGHLAMLTAEAAHTNALAMTGIQTSTSLRPDFIASIYPVVSMSDKTTHKRSRRALLGERHKRDKRMRDSLSLEKHVTSDLPPVFLMNCKDDPIVNYHNSELLDSALTAHNVNHVYIQYKTGGHGFGATPSKTTPEAIQWKEEFLKWLRTLFN